MRLALEKMSSEYVGLAWKFRVSPESCDNPDHYESFLRLSAITEQNSGRGVTHVLVTLDDESGNVNDDSEIIGFMTLRATSLVDSTSKLSYVRPSLEIAELAINQKHERQGFGTKLVGAAILIATQLNERFIGIQNVVLCADPKAVGFYEKPDVGFGKMTDYYDILPDGWNDHCVPMYIRLSI